MTEASGAEQAAASTIGSAGRRTIGQCVNINTRIVHLASFTTNTSMPTDVLPPRPDRAPERARTASERHKADLYDAYAALLSPASAYPAGRYRSTSEIADGLKRLRRLILTEGIPDVVSSSSGPQSVEREGARDAELTPIVAIPTSPPAAYLEAHAQGRPPPRGRLPALRRQRALERQHEECVVWSRQR